MSVSNSLKKPENSPDICASKKESFQKVNASMNLLNDKKDKVIPCDVSVSGAYVVINGEDHMVLTVYDVTELQNVQRLLNIERKNSISAERLKSTFIANISHEVRTPLNAIVGFSGLIATASDEEEKKLYMDIISENNERLLRLINDIFDLSQIEAGTLNFEYSEFDANDLLRELEGMFKVKLFNNPSVDLNSLNKSLASNSEYSKFKVPASICERSKISFIKRNKRSLFSEIISIYNFFSSSSEAVAINPEKPTIAFNGVRTS